ncbi:MAG: hypothetical protein ABI091_16415 [Ferruginibacter sp.]
MRFLFTDNTLLGLHLMLTGDIFVFDKTNDYKFTIVEKNFSNGKGLVLTDRMRNANVRLNPVDKRGPDAISKELNFKYLKEVFKTKRKVKDLLLDQDVIRGCKTFTALHL